MLPSFELWDPPPPKRADKALTGSSASFNTFTADLKVTQEINQCELAWHHALQAQHHVICYLFKKWRRLRIKLISKNTGPVLILKIIFRHWNCFLSSVATDGKDYSWCQRLFMRGFRFRSRLIKWPAPRVFGLRSNTCRLAADETKLSVAREKTPLVPRVSKDGHRLKLEKIWPTFSSFNAMPAKKITKKIIMVSIPW